MRSNIQLNLRQTFWKHQLRRKDKKWKAKSRRWISGLWFVV